ncbi:helix-turn-helix transcriptional regulator [Micromonospora sp. WMMD980]|uniref:helix-turn-helix domain-containing protein n=1 Tax=Micromonospora sp. WMMD980 TaxID=3016088 RepID=UPI0024176E95|nr:helix-turn-helix transcriptional regulator [Micromonospora sp. WMMD980]MDG4801210.1 helix-turn-helix transcriptional regulator [Micromonospora sp. WMMD980]
MTGEPIGRRVARWRVRRRLTQQMLADRLGKSKSWVDKVERGVRGLDRYSVIQDIADVLRVEPSVLLGERFPPSVGTLDGVDEVRAALASYDSGRNALSHEELRRRVAHAWLTYQHAHYAQTVRLLPGLLDSARGMRGAAPELPVQVFRAASSVLVKLGEADLGWLAADRAVAGAGGDPMLTALAVASVGEALRALGQDRLALAVTAAVAPVSAAHGPLLIQAALAAAGCGESRRAGELLDRAAELAARRKAGDEPHPAGFGPAAVELARVVAAAKSGDGGEAVYRHERMLRREAWRRLPVEFRGAYLLDAARAYLQLGDLRGAGRAVVEADGVAPAEVRLRPVARTVVAEIARGHPAPPGVARLATLVGLTR